MSWSSTSYSQDLAGTLGIEILTAGQLSGRRYRVLREATTTLRTQLRRICAKYKLHLVVADENRIVDNDLNANVVACLLGSRYGIAMFAQPETKQTVNPNVAYELGLMHRKVCLILKDRRLKKLPTDLIAHLYVDYSPADAQELNVHVETWIQDRVLAA